MDHGGKVTHNSPNEGHALIGLKLVGTVTGANPQKRRFTSKSVRDYDNKNNHGSVVKIWL